MNQFCITPDTKIYVHCPAGIVTGGTELLHQLVDFLNRNGRCAYIVYDGQLNHKLPEAFGMYKIRPSEIVEDSISNIEIFPETMMRLISRTNNTQKAIWWMSVDNYFFRNNCAIWDALRWDFAFGLKNIYKKFRSLFRRTNMYGSPISITQLRERHFLHLVQSEYARRFVEKHSLGSHYWLEDYINPDFLCNGTNTDRENLVLYNPSKGYKFTAKIILRNSDIKFIPLTGFSRVQLKNLMGKSKIYIDFGNHPGKDRLPRECAMNGCVIITGKRGSAGNSHDMGISSRYKFDENQIEDISDLIADIFNHYTDHYNAQKEYRLAISEEKQRFENQIRILFDIQALQM